ncbi:hypothetical protein DFH28DRAFT_443341 [Melampsora americana]|nr:hypothetical protein DFH28DRAFT_443341 [Melampsora americana]
MNLVLSLCCHLLPSGFSQQEHRKIHSSPLRVHSVSFPPSIMPISEYSTQKSLVPHLSTKPQNLERPDEKSQNEVWYHLAVVLTGWNIDMYSTRDG